MKIDATTIAIIKHLRQGRKSFKKIAQQLDIAENTVRARITRMTEEGLLEVAGLVNPEALPGHSLLIVGVKLKTTDLVNKGEEFSKIKGVVSVCVVTGRYDLMLVVFLKEPFGLLQFYTEEVSKIRDVQSLETFVVYKAFNMKVPYIL